MKKLLLEGLCLCMMLLSGPGVATLQAQNPRPATVTGEVRDEAGNPVVGAAVLVQGTNKGQTVGADGKFAIEAAAGETLVVSMLGYATQELRVGNRTHLNVTLAEDSKMIESVVVEIGYGNQRLVDVTGTLGRVKMEDLVKAPVASFDQALQGRLAGVSVNSSDGTPGAEMDIVIRGANSLTQSNSPLYVIDGFPIEDFSSAAINTADIASLTVLKDASATAIYGSRGANGVIIIETHKGQEGKPKVTYNGTVGFQEVTKRMELMTPYEFVVYQIERSPANLDRYLTKPERTLDFYRSHEGIDWQDRLFRTALMHTHNVSVSGGTKQTRYVVSGSAVDQDGVIDNSGYKKYQGRVSLDTKLGKRVRLSVNANYTHDKTHGQTTSKSLASANAYASYLMYRTWAYRPVILNTSDSESLFDDENDTSVMNPIISNANEQTTKKTSTFLSNAKVEWEIIDGLKLTVRAGYGKKTIRQEEFNNSLTYQGFPRAGNNRGVNATFSERTLDDWMNENTLVYKREFSKKHKLDVTVGYTMQGTVTSNYGFGTSYIPNEFLGLSGMDDGIPYSTTALLSENALMSWLGRVNYSYRSRYLFTASFRADGSSKFTPGNRWGIFPSGAFAWRLGQEKFMRKLKFVDDAKLRVSYGVTGNNRIGDFATYPSLTQSDYYSFGNGTPSEAVVPSNLGNRELTWESTEQVDLGLDLSLFRNRVNLTVDLYRKTTRDLLLNANLPFTSGYSSVYKNVGKVRNDGLELTLSTVNVDTKDFKWTSDFNISFNRNRVMALAEGQESLLSTVAFTTDFNSTPLYIARVGGPMAAFYGIVWDGVYGYDDFETDATGAYVLKKNVPTNGDARETIQPGDIKYVDQNGDGVVNDQDMVIIGRGTPIHTGGFNNNFTYKGLSLNVFFQWSYGNDIMNANRIIFEGNYNGKNINQFRSYVDHWTPENQTSRNFRPGGQGPRGIYSSRTIEDGSFLRLKTVQLSYTLPERWVAKLRLEQVQVYVSGQNLWTLTGYSGLDPEVSTRNSALTPGYDYSAYARNRTYTAGLKIVF
ncbi:MAG: TonB-dependent receptor [Alistipes sp.]|nr:TonB-dependent receptor [Alistipes sp.]